MKTTLSDNEATRTALANRLFFRLYQCVNMLHKTGTRAIEAHGLTTQQWAVLGALSRPEAEDGMKIGDLAHYLMVSRQNLSGVVGRLERNGHLTSISDPNDRRSRRVRMTSSGRKVWLTHAVPLISEYYGTALEGFSINDMVHMVHYLLRILENMRRLDTNGGGAGEA